MMTPTFKLRRYVFKLAFMSNSNEILFCRKEIEVQYKDVLDGLYKEGSS
jgi:hypothetical protein